MVHICYVYGCYENYTIILKWGQEEESWSLKDRDH